MLLHRTTRNAIGSGLLACGLIAVSHAEQAYPSRPITLIVPYAAGGTTDVVARQFAMALQKSTKQTVIVENKPGVSGTLGAMALKKAAPDGYTLSLIPATVFRQPFIQKASYDPATDFTYLSRISGYTFGIVVQKESPWKSWTDLVAAAKATPDKYTYGVPGQYSTPHITMLEISSKLGLALTPIPYKSDGECLPALLGGHVDMCAAGSSAGTLVDAGKLRWLNIWTEQRSPSWADVPTLRDLGIDMVSSSPYGVAGPKGMSENVVRVLEHAIRDAVNDPEHIAALQRQQQDLLYMDSTAYTAFAMQQIERERAVVKQLGLNNN